MTAPNPGDEKAPAAKPAKVSVLTVGFFRHRDPILGSELDRAGVVVKVGDRLLVTPLEHYRVEVDPAEFEPLTPDDLA